MIHMKFSSPALIGQPVKMTVTQGRVSRNLSIDVFGVKKAPAAGSSNDQVILPKPPSGGSSTASLTISVRRGQQKVAPEGIAFFAETSGFAARKPTDGTVYDPTMHDIHYTWSFGDPGEFTGPENILPEWKNRNTAYGPFPAHVFTRPGSYTVTCTAHEPATGMTAMASLQVVVEDPEAVFTAATTIVCASAGDFSGAPAHDPANRTTTFADAISRLKALKAVGKPTRLLLRGGDRFTMTGNTYVGPTFYNLYVSSFGTGRAIIQANAVGAVFQIWNTLPVSGASISRLAFNGPWDSTTEIRDPAYTVGKTPVGVDVSSGFCTVHDCIGSGLYQAVTTGTIPGLTAIISDCRSTNWEDYGMYVGAENQPDPAVPLTSYVGILGCRFDQNPNALQGGNGKHKTDLGNRHGVLRAQAVGFLNVDAFDAFSRNGWTVVGGVPADQNIIRDHRNHSGSRAFFSRVMGEGGWQGYGNGAASPDGGADGDGAGFHVPCNTVIDKAYFLGSARTVSHLGITAGAFTGRNIVLHRPNVGTGTDAFNSSISLGTAEVADFSAANRSSPIRLYNITVINELDNTQQANNARSLTAWNACDIRPNCYDPGAVQIENLVVHRPDFAGGTTPDAPLNATRLGLVPRYLGYRWKNHTASNLGDRVTMDTSFATPANPWSLWRPVQGSAAIGSALGLVAYDDLLGKVRPAPASRGASEPA